MVRMYKMPDGMKKWKRKLALFMAGFLAFGMGGCGNSGGDFGEGSTELPVSAQGEGGGEEGARGRYIETLKDTPEDLKAIESMTRLSDGSIAIINPDTGDLLLSKDNGDSWEKKALPALAEKLGSEEIEITSKAAAPDGGVFFSYVNWGEPQENGVDEKYVYIDKDGQDSEVELSMESGDKFYLSDAGFIGERALVGMMNGGYVYRFDLDEKIMKQISANSSEDLYEKLFLAGDYLVTKEWLYQFSSGNTIEDTVLCDFIGQESPLGQDIAFCFNEEENMVYSASKSGLYGHVIGGGTMEKLLDGGLCGLGDPTKNAAAILQNEDGSFLIGYEDGEIDLYAYDAKALSVPDRQISVFSMEQNVTVSRAVSIFRKNNPDVYVKQEIGISGDYGVTKEDVVRNLNTRLLAGEGPDIILLDDMPMDSYIEKNILLDLTETVQELEKESAYFDNIFKVYERDGGLYAVPMRFRIPVVFGEKDVISGVGDAASLNAAVKKAREKAESATTILGTYTAEELLKRMYLLLSADGFVQKDGLDAAALKDFLEQAKEIYEEEQKNITEDKMQAYTYGINWREEQGIKEEEGNFPVGTNNVFDMLAGDQKIVIGTISGIEDLQYAVGMQKHEKLPNTAYSLLSGQSVFAPKGICGINAESKELEIAKAFLKELLGTETQKVELGDGFPVNEDAFALFSQNPNPNTKNEMGFSASVVGDDGNASETVHFSMSWPQDGEIEELKQQIMELKKPGLSDDVIRTALLESGKKVLEGDLGVDEGCDEIVQKVDLYLAE